MLEVEPARHRGHTIWTPEMVETAMKSSRAPLQSHSLDGCTVVCTMSNCHRQAYRFSVRYLHVLHYVLHWATDDSVATSLVHGTVYTFS